MNSSDSDNHVNFWAVVPAAGVGRRMQSVAQQVPKQYLKIRGQSVLALTLKRLDMLKAFSGIVLVLNADDTWYPKLDIKVGERLMLATGGSERAISVFNGLEALADQADDNDWVLVHDVVRPCVDMTDLHNLIGQLSTDDVGGLLVIPVSETLKQVNEDGSVVCTVPRESYRLAGTPQMFRFGLLRDALASALAAGTMVTDEAHAMELAGHRVKTVQGGADNLKITHPEDLVLAEFILNRQRAL